MRERTGNSTKIEEINLLRIKLSLQPVEAETRIPINYQYPLSAAIYKIVSAASPEYAGWLHARGYLSSNGKPMKLFVFSRLIFQKPERLFNVLIVKNHSPCTLYISSPMLDDFVQNFVAGLFDQTTIEIGNPQTVGRFRVTGVETLPDPDFSSAVMYRCLSPIVVSTIHEHNGKLHQYYLRPDDERLSELVRNNLIRKHEIVYGELPANVELTFTPDAGYIQRRGGTERVSKLITVKEWEDRRAVRVKSFMVPFEMHGSTALIKTAYECGIGEKNSMGFGMIEVM